MIYIWDRIEHLCATVPYVKQKENIEAHALSCQKLLFSIRQPWFWRTNHSSLSQSNDRNWMCLCWHPYKPFQNVCATSCELTGGQGDINWRTCVCWIPMLLCLPFISLIHRFVLYGFTHSAVFIAVCVHTTSTLLFKLLQFKEPFYHFH